MFVFVLACVVLCFCVLYRVVIDFVVCVFLVVCVVLIGYLCGILVFILC